MKVLEMKSKVAVTRGKGKEDPQKNPREPIITKTIDVDADPNGQESNSSLHSSHYPGSKASSQKPGVVT